MAEVGGSYKAALTKEQEDELRAIAAKICQPGKGILAADESTGMFCWVFDAKSLNVKFSRNNWKTIC